jgi:hypothetical protein
MKNEKLTFNGFFALFTLFLCLIIFTGCPEIEEDDVYDIDEEYALNGNFSDDTVLIVLTKEASFIDKLYTPKDFPEINCLYVANLSYDIMIKIKDGPDWYINTWGGTYNDYIEYKEDFRRILILTLAEKDKRNVLIAIKKLEKRKDVETAEEDHYMELD